MTEERQPFYTDEKGSLLAYAGIHQEDLKQEIIWEKLEIPEHDYKTKTEKPAGPDRLTDPAWIVYHLYNMRGKGYYGGFQPGDRIFWYDNIVPMSGRAGFVWLRNGYVWATHVLAMS